MIKKRGALLAPPCSLCVGDDYEVNSVIIPTLSELSRRWGRRARSMVSEKSLVVSSNDAPSMPVTFLPRVMLNQR